MIQDVRGREGIDALASNPMLLTAMCIIYNEGKRLPHDKYELYDRIVDNVLHNRYVEDAALIHKVRSRLAVIAHGMHTGEGLGEQRGTPQATITYDEIDRVLQSYLELTPHTEEALSDAVETRENLLSNAGLLLPGGEKQAHFYHLSIQEFLAAGRVRDLEDDLAHVLQRRAEVPAMA